MSYATHTRIGTNEYSILATGGKHEPCEATVRLYDEYRNNIIEVFRLTEVLPERSVIGPRDDKRPDERVVECADYRFVDRVEITDN